MFIAPLLFLDGWRIPKDAFFSDWGPILTLAFGIVVFTVIGLGPLIETIIPVIPLSVAFAVAATLSPTDAVAISEISAGAPVPVRLMHILDGEALLNDASGLVCFCFVVAAALTGSFSLADATLTFFQTAAGGLLAGILISFGACDVYHWFSRRTGEEPGTPILISVLIPFAAYLPQTAWVSQASWRQRRRCIDALKNDPHSKENRHIPGRERRAVRHRHRQCQNTGKSHRALYPGKCRDTDEPRYRPGPDLAAK